MVWTQGMVVGPTNLNATIPSWGSTRPFYDATQWGAVGDDNTDNTSAMQGWLNAIAANQAVGYIPPGIYRCGMLVDSTSSRLAIYGGSGTTIRSTATTWLYVAPLQGGKYGVTLRDLTFGAPVSGNASGVPYILLEGSSTSGGIIDVDINNIGFYPQMATIDGLHLYACFQGRVANIHGSSMQSSRAIVYSSKDYNSGNFHFDTIACAHSAIALQLSKAANSTTNQQLLNQVLLSNIKAVRTAGTESGHYATTGTAHAAGASVLSLPAADVSNVTVGDWVVASDPYLFGDCHRITSILSTTAVQLDRPLVSAITSGTTLVIGNVGIVVGANCRGFQLNTPHTESYGFGVICSGGQQVQINNLLMGQNVRRGVLAYNGAQNVKVWYPIYSKSETTKVLMEAFYHNLSNVNTFNNALLGPAGFSSGAGPASYLSDANGDAANNVYLANPDTTVLALAGTGLAPSVAFKSEQSLGFYSSAASTINTSYGTFSASLIHVGIDNFNLGSSVGSLARMQFTGQTYQFLNSTNAAAGISTGSVGVGAGTQGQPSMFVSSETSLGLYASGASTLAQSYGILNLKNAALSLRTSASNQSASNLTQGEIALMNVSATSAQLVFRSGNTSYVFNAIQASP